MELSDILEVGDDPTRPRWVEIREMPGLALKLRLPDLPGLKGLAQIAVYEASRQAPEGGAGDILEADPGAVGVKWALYAVQDWRGLTGATLRRLAAGARDLAVKIAPEAEIPFRRDLLEVLLRRAPRFYDCLERAWRELETKGLAAQAEDDENLGSAPATTPTPPVDIVAGA